MYTLLLYLLSVLIVLNYIYFPDWFLYWLVLISHAKIILLKFLHLASSIDNYEDQ